jgi:hypothetical protein
MVVGYSFRLPFFSLRFDALPGAVTAGEVEAALKAPSVQAISSACRPATDWNSARRDPYTQSLAHPL